MQFVYEKFRSFFLQTLAERAGWDFVKDLPADEKFELSVINPAFVMGPVLSGNISASQEVCDSVLVSQV